jgi:hypothetical protein
MKIVFRLNPINLSYEEFMSLLEQARRLAGVRWATAQGSQFLGAPSCSSNLSAQLDSHRCKRGFRI